MLRITPETLSAFENEHARKKGLRFGSWWQQHAAQLGPRDHFSCARLIDGMAEEIEITGLAAENQQFLFVAARCRMPDMGNEQYLRTLDAIAGRGDDAAKLAAIDAIARTVSADA